MKKGYVISFLLGLIVMTCIGVYAINASEITYKESNVEDALDTLYGKAHLTATPVATLTTRGATYTMQNDGYITGTAASSNDRVASISFNNSETYILSNESYSGNRSVSLYVPKGTVISTRSEGGTYNLTIYEWK